jgi:general secretion pathway protein J
MTSKMTMSVLTEVSTMPSMRLSKNRGFTLIELVVAMAIFAVLTLSGWQVFNNLIKVRERTTIKAEQLAAIQEAYEQLSRDLVQVVPRPVSIGASSEAAFLLQNNVFHFTRTGIIDPLQQGISPMQRVYYTVEQEQLIRYAVAQIDQNGNTVPSKTVLLNHVTNWSVSALTNSNSSPIWPSNIDASTATSSASGDITLPTAVQINLTTNGQSLRWLFSLVPNMPAPAVAGTGTNTVIGGAGAAALGNTQSTTTNNITTSGGQ